MEVGEFCDMVITMMNDDGGWFAPGPSGSLASDDIRSLLSGASLPTRSLLSLIHIPRILPAKRLEGSLFFESSRVSKVLPLFPHPEDFFCGC